MLCCRWSPAGRAPRRIGARDAVRQWHHGQSHRAWLCHRHARCHVVHVGDSPGAAVGLQRRGCGGCGAAAALFEWHGQHDAASGGAASAGAGEPHQRAAGERKHRRGGGDDASHGEHRRVLQHYRAASAGRRRGQRELVGRNDHRHRCKRALHRDNSRADNRQRDSRGCPCQRPPEQRKRSHRAARHRRRATTCRGGGHNSRGQRRHAADGNGVSRRRDIVRWADAHAGSWRELAARGEARLAANGP